ncbi:MAG: hypothetical protein WBM90_12760 [Acidimicrobiia bacterium]
MRLVTVAVFAVLALVVSACGGGGGDDSGLGDDVFGGIGDAAGENQDSDGGGGVPGAGEAGPVTGTADPTTAWVEVEGQRFEFEVPGSVHHQCIIGEERVTINYQETETGSLLIQGQNLGDGWLLSLTVAAGGSNVSYGGSLPGDGSLGIDGSSLSYEGPADRVEDYDIVNATEVDISLAVNCTPPGDGITATVGGTEYQVQFSGSVRCEITDEMIEVAIGDARAQGGALDAELQMGAIRDGDGEWFGSATVRTADGTSYTSEMSAEGDLPTVDGLTISYEGTFSSDAGDVDGSVSFSCP